MKNTLKYSLLSSLLLTLAVSATAQAVTLRGEIQPDRYTYYLTPAYGKTLKALNDKSNRPYYPIYPHGELYPYGSYQQTKDKPAPTAMTCISSVYYNRGAAANWLKIACVDNNGLEYEGNQKWPPKSVATRICKVGEARCDSFLSLESDGWSGPQ
ncbi:hypothetical protein [Providencia manganoxydans]|uniref:hypothetical protein n=1 Tax=Providencia manganoxydans TaxID=2923283 RepID=UPI0032D9CB45